MSKVISVNIQKDDGKQVKIPFGISQDKENYKTCKVFDTIKDVQGNGQYINTNDYIKTLGYYSVGDGGGAQYIATGTGDKGFGRVTLNNGIKIKLLKSENGCYNVLQLGITGSNCKEKIKDLYASAPQGTTLYFPPGKYKMPEEHWLLNTKGVSLLGAGWQSKLISPTTVSYTAVSTNGSIENFTTQNITFSGSMWKNNIHSLPIKAEVKK